MYVVSLPVRSAEIVLDPKKDDYANLDVVLHNVKKLKCDMYDNALFPVALVNKLVSLSNHPSAVNLENSREELWVRHRPFHDPAAMTANVLLCGS
jgi:hypothetical protein